MSLAALQRRFAAYVRDPSGDRGEFVRDTAEASREQRLGVYAHAFRARALEALEADFPALAAWLGAEAFAALAHDYLAAHPSRSFSLRDFGAALPAHLRAADAVPRELAAFEWALCEAFDAADAAALRMEAIAGLPAEAWPTLRFTCHPSLQRLTLETNAPAIWAANDAGAPWPVVERARAAVPWLVWRQDLKLMYRALGAAEAAALDAARAGAGFGEICVVLAGSGPAAQVPALAAGLLRQWLAAGLFVGLDAGSGRTP